MPDKHTTEAASKAFRGLAYALLAELCAAVVGISIGVAVWSLDWSNTLWVTGW